MILRQNSEHCSSLKAVQPLVAFSQAHGGDLKAVYGHCLFGVNSRDPQRRTVAT